MQPKNVLSALFPFELIKQNQACMSVHGCMNCIESHYLWLKAYRCDLFEEITGACRENMERDEFARSCSRLETKFGDIYVENEAKFILDTLVSESFSSMIQTKPFWRQRMSFNR